MLFFLFKYLVINPNFSNYLWPGGVLLLLDVVLILQQLVFVFTGQIFYLWVEGNISDVVSLDTQISFLRIQYLLVWLQFIGIFVLIQLCYATQIYHVGYMIIYGGVTTARRFIFIISV